MWWVLKSCPRPSWTRRKTPGATALKTWNFTPRRRKSCFLNWWKKGCGPRSLCSDPPRKGCEEAVLAAIAQAALERVVYVSCDPATLARDAKFLCAHSFQALRRQSVDMFCARPGM